MLVNLCLYYSETNETNDSHCVLEKYTEILKFHNNNSNKRLVIKKHLWKNNKNINLIPM